MRVGLAGIKLTLAHFYERRSMQSPQLIVENTAGWTVSFGVQSILIYLFARHAILSYSPPQPRRHPASSGDASPKAMSQAQR